MDSTITTDLANLATEINEAPVRSNDSPLAVESLTDPIADVNADHDIARELNKIPNGDEIKKELAKAEADDNKNKGIFERFISDADFRNISISGLNAVLHAVATVTNFAGKDNKALGLLNTIFDKAAIICTRWVAPIISYGYSAGEALFKDGKPLLALIKLVPPVFLPLVGDANIDTVYGSSTGFNQPYDMVESRIRAKSEESEEYKKYADKKNSTMMGNMELLVSEFKNMFQDFVSGKLNTWDKFWKEGVFMINCSAILAGSIPIMLFARHARDTGFAQVMGLIRNLGGILGDVGLVMSDRHILKKLLSGGLGSLDSVDHDTKRGLYKLGVGALCSVAAIADIAKRRVGEEAARVLIHLGAALNVTAYSLWNAFNSSNAKEKKAA